MITLSHRSYLSIKDPRRDTPTPVDGDREGWDGVDEDDVNDNDDDATVNEGGWGEAGAKVSGWEVVALVGRRRRALASSSVSVHPLDDGGEGEGVDEADKGTEEVPEGGRATWDARRKVGGFGLVGWTAGLIERR